MKKSFNICITAMTIGIILLLIQTIVFQIIYGLHWKATELPEMISDLIINIIFMVAWCAFLWTVVSTIEWAIKAKKELDDLKYRYDTYNNLLKTVKQEENDKKAGDSI